jgi:sulfur carrier protein
MNIQLNGQPRELPESITVAALLADLNMADRPVAVEVNRELVTRAEHESCPLNEGDIVEIVTLVGGG